MTPRKERGLPHIGQMLILARIDLVLISSEKKVLLDAVFLLKFIKIRNDWKVTSYLIKGLCYLRHTWCPHNHLESKMSLFLFFLFFFLLTRPRELGPKWKPECIREESPLKWDMSSHTWEESPHKWEGKLVHVGEDGISMVWTLGMLHIDDDENSYGCLAKKYIDKGPDCKVHRSR